jgi:hypothetical protein
MLNMVFFEYTIIRSTDNRALLVNGNQTTWVNPFNYKNLDLEPFHCVIPLHLEFDFSKSKVDGKTVF